jgi:hypothetical protein
VTPPEEEEERKIYMAQPIPFPPLAFNGDIILVGADDDGSNPGVIAVLSPRQKRTRIPFDSSTVSERAEWIGVKGMLNEKLVIYVDAVKWRNIWYVQYSEITQPSPIGEKEESNDDN